jgi:hypothetical protein
LWLNRLATLRGMTALLCPLWWGKHINSHLSAACWPMPSSIPSNHTFCRVQLKADSIIPAKRFTSRRATGVRQQMRENFPHQKYCRRSLIESVFSAVKRKLSCRAAGRTIATQSRQALLLGLAFNLYRLWLARRSGVSGEDVNGARWVLGNSAARSPTASFTINPLPPTAQQ